MPYKINLLGPVEKKKRRELAESKSSVLLPILLMIVYGVCFFVFLTHPLNQDIAQKKQEISLLDKEISDMPELVRGNNVSVASLKDRVIVGEQLLSSMAELKSRRNSAMFALVSIHNNIPDEVWVDSLNFADNIVTLKGHSTLSEAVFDFNKKLDSMTEFKTSKVASITGGGDQAVSAPIVDYIITIEIKNIFDL